MNKASKLRLAGGVATMTVALSIVAPVTASADATVAMNHSKSNRVIRVWKDHGCPNTLEGFKNSEVLSEGEMAPFTSVGSAYQAPYRVVTWNYAWSTRTWSKGKCYNIPRGPVMVMVVKYRR